MEARCINLQTARSLCPHMRLSQHWIAKSIILWLYERAQDRSLNRGEAAWPQRIRVTLASTNSECPSHDIPTVNDQLRFLRSSYCLAYDDCILAAVLVCWALHFWSFNSSILGRGSTWRQRSTMREPEATVDWCLNFHLRLVLRLCKFENL